MVIPGHNLGNSQVSVYKTIGPTLVNVSASRGVACTILMPLVWRGHVSNPRPTAPKADPLPLELSGPIDR